MNPITTASIVLSVMLSAAMFTRAAENPTDDEIRAILRERIDTAKKGVGVVVGIIDEKGTRIVGYGWTDNDKSREADGDTVFEIGSATKVFTSLVLADMVQHGEVKLDDPISKYLPKSVKVPPATERKSRSLTWPRTPPACRGCRTILRRRMRTIPTPTTRLNKCMIFSLAAP